MAQRFYKTASVKGQGPFTVELDNRQLRTPMKQIVSVDKRSVAEAIAEEWLSQGQEIDPSSMPITRLANTAIDRVAGREEQIVEEIVAFADSDLICYRAAEPTKLAERQFEHWEPVLRWVEGHLGAKFSAGEGVTYRPQAPEALDALRLHLLQMEAHRLCALHNLTTLLGSAFLSLAVTARQLTPEQAWTAAHIDEDWQIEHWGKDEEAEDRRARRQREFTDTVRFLGLMEQWEDRT